jgi:uncharacterized protein (UPF0128 family)
MESARETERQLIFRQRGIMNRIVDSGARLMSAGFNKLIEEWKAQQGQLKDKMKFIIASLTDKDKALLLCGYNGLKTRALMLNGVGMNAAQQQKIQLIKRLTNQGYNMQVMAINGIKEFLASERRSEEAARLEYERQQREKDRILKRIMNSNVRMMGIGFRQSFQFMEAERDAEIAKMAKQRGILRRIVDSNVRLMAQGWNKLIEEYKARMSHLKDKMKFVIAALTDADKAFIMCAYNGLKQRALMLNGVGLGDAQMKKIQLIKRLTNKGYNLQVMAINGIKEYLISERTREEAARLEHERQQREKSRILKRIMDSNVRMMGTGFRQSFQWMQLARDLEIQKIARQRGIMRRIVDTNTRLMSQGWNKLLESFKERSRLMQEKLKFVIKSLTDKDASYKIMAYNGFKQRTNMLNGIGVTAAGMLKQQLIKRLTSQAYNLQILALNSIRAFLHHERTSEEALRQAHLTQQIEKTRILKRIMDSNLRIMGTTFRQSSKFATSQKASEILLANKQRGIMRRVIDSGTRLMGMALRTLQGHL